VRAKRTVNAANKTRGVTGTGRIEHGGLLNRTAQFAHANDFKSVSHAATKFLFRPGATGGEQCDKKKPPRGKKVHYAINSKVDTRILRQIQRM